MILDHSNSRSIFGSTLRSNLPAVRDGDMASATIPHLDVSAVRSIIDAARTAPHTGERQRVSDRGPLQRLSPSVRGVGAAPPGPGAVGYGLGRPRHGQGAQVQAGGTERLAVGQMHAYAYRLGLPRESRGHQVNTEAAVCRGHPQRHRGGQMRIRSISSSESSSPERTHGRPGRARSPVTPRSFIVSIEV